MGDIAAETLRVCHAGGPPGMNRGPPLERANSSRGGGARGGGGGGIEGDKWSQRGPSQGPPAFQIGSQFRPTPPAPSLHKTANRWGLPSVPLAGSACIYVQLQAALLMRSLGRQMELHETKWRGMRIQEPGLMCMAVNQPDDADAIFMPYCLWVPLAGWLPAHCLSVCVRMHACACVRACLCACVHALVQRYF